MLHSLLKYLWLIATVLWFLFMTYLSHQNGNSTAETSLKLAEFLGDENLNGNLRRAAHVFLFFILAILFSLTLDAWGKDERLVFLVSLWAIIDEWTKIFIDGRHFSWFDVGLNEIGSVIGIVGGMVIRVWV